MLTRNCGEIGRGARASAASGRRRRHRLEARRPLRWRLEARLYGPLDDGPDEDGSEQTGRPVGRADQRPEDRQAAAPVGLAWLWQVLRQSAAAREQWSELLRLATATADRDVRAETLNVVGQFATAAGDLGMAQSFFQEALVAGRAGQDAANVARSLGGLARVAASRGAFDLARTLEEEVLTIRRRLGDPSTIATSLAVLGWLTLESGGATQAEALHEESLTLRVSLGEPLMLGYSLVHLGWLAHLTGREEEARQHLAEALGTVRRHPDRWKIVALLALLGRHVRNETPAHHAVAILTAAESHEEATDPCSDEAERPPLDLTAARQRLDARVLAYAWGGGRDTDAEGLVDRALRATDLRTRLTSFGRDEAAGSMPLTPRELEVARLICQGSTNRRIAEALVIAERTAETHARNIREKLGLTTRAQIAAWVAIHARPESPES